MFRRTSTQLYCFFHIAVTTAVSVSVCIIRMVPDAHADIVDPGIRQDLKEIPCIAVFVIIHDTAFFFRDQRRNIHTADKVLRKSVDRLHKDLCGFFFRRKCRRIGPPDLQIRCFAAVTYRFRGNLLPVHCLGRDVRFSACGNGHKQCHCSSFNIQRAFSHPFLLLCFLRFRNSF